MSDVYYVQNANITKNNYIYYNFELKNYFS